MQKFIIVMIAALLGVTMFTGCRFRNRRARGPVLIDEGRDRREPNVRYSRRHHDARGGRVDFTTSRVAPPAPPKENRPPRPAIGYVWISGYYELTGEGFSWVRGFWGTPKRGKTWEQGSWRVSQSGEYVWVQGYWR